VTFQYQPIEQLPGWNVAVYEDGKALPVAPRCGADELGGHAAAYDTVSDAICMALVMCALMQTV